jgi:glycerol-3-phosphate dehydrogenase
MGPCQGGFCTYRAVGILHELQQTGQGPDAPPTEGRTPVHPLTPTWDVAHLQSPSHNQRPSGERTANPPVASPALLLRDFLQERWRGLTPILWGRQLKQERLDELIYLSVMNADHLPDDGAASPLSEFWEFDTTPSAAGEQRAAKTTKQVPG